jgi:IS5 family transposase
LGEILHNIYYKQLFAWYVDMSFSLMDVERRTRKGNFLRQIDVLIDWRPIAALIALHYHPKSDVIGRPAYPGILLFKMLLVGIWYKGLSDEAVEDIANSNLYVMRFLGLQLEDNVPDHSVLSKFRTALTKARVWDSVLNEVNRQLTLQDVMVKDGYHVDASVTVSPRKPTAKPALELVPATDAKDGDGNTDTSQAVFVEVAQGDVDPEAGWTKKGGKYLFGYKQHTLVDNNGLVQGIETTAANTHDSGVMIKIVDKCNLPKGSRLCADKAYNSKKHTDYLKAKGLKNGIQNKAVRGKPLTKRQKARNKLITKIRFVVERTFGGQALWFGGKNLRYVGLNKAHAWHVLQGIAYNLKRLPVLYCEKHQQGSFVQNRVIA